MNQPRADLASARPEWLSRDWLLAHLRFPLFRNAYALMLSAGLTSALGFLYWMIAARLYPAEIVGINSAAMSAMIFLAGLGQVDLANVVVRFIPQAGRGAQALIDRATSATVLASLLASLVFLVGVDFWAPSLGMLRENLLLGMGFSVSAAVWGVFMLQDGVMTGLRRATWVPVRGAVFAVGKIVLLLAFLFIMPRIGIFASWIVPAALVLIPTGLVVRRHLADPSEFESRSEVVGHSRSQIIRFTGANYFGTIFWLGATLLTPVLVTDVAGATANAYFYISWTIAFTLFLVAPAMGLSLVVEAAIEPEKLGAYGRRALVHTASLVVPAAVVLCLIAPYLLGWLGGSYAVEGTRLLQLIAISAIPNIVNALHTNIARARRELGLIVAINAAQCISVLALSYVLLHTMGITGVGVAWLTSQTVVAAGLLVLRRSVLKSGERIDEAR